MKNRIRGLGLALVMALGTPAGAEPLAGPYLAAKFASQQADFAAASRYYAAVLRADPDNLDILERGTVARFSMGDLSGAADLARRIEVAGRTSQIGQLVLLIDAGVQGRFLEISDRIANDRGAGPLSDSLLLGWAFLAQGDSARALAQFDEAARTSQMTGLALYNRGLALTMLGEYDAAAAALADARLQSFGETRHGVIALAKALGLGGRADEALALLRNSFSDPQSDPQLRPMIRALETGAPVRLTIAQSPQDGLAKVFYAIAQILARDSGDAFTLLYARAATLLRPDHWEAHLLTAQLLSGLEQYALAQKAYALVPADSALFIDAQAGLSDVLSQTGQMEAAIATQRDLAELHPDFAEIHANLGDLLRRDDRFAEAEAAYDRALALRAPDDTTIWSLLFARAVARERQGNWSAAEADFRAALALNPEQPQVLNYLGYSLIIRGEKLREALDMIERAVAVRPNSGYIVDSLGWALFQLGDYDAAVIHLERAAELMPIDPVVNDHLGDALWAVGRVVEARFHWRRALSFHDHEAASEELDPDVIRQKLENGLPDLAANSQARDPASQND